MILNRDLAWRYFVVTEFCLIAYLIKSRIEWIYVAIGISCIHLLHFSVREKSLITFPVQVRIAFLIFLTVGLIPALNFIYWIPAFGLAAVILTGYCFLARVLSLLPWNRREAISWKLLKRTFFSKPVKGSILQGLPQE